AARVCRGAVVAAPPAPLSERHGAFVIIAIGESLIIAGSAVANVERSVALEAGAAGAILVASLLWWSYFGWLEVRLLGAVARWLRNALQDAYARVPLERNGDVARDAFSLAHFPLIAGIVGFAVALEGIGTHPDEPLSVAVLASLGIGVALFVGSSALALRLAGGPLLVPHLWILAFMIGAF